MGSVAGTGFIDRIRRKPLLFILAVSAILFYVTPFYNYKSAFPIICRNGTCQPASPAGATLSLWETLTPPEYVVYTPGCKIMEMNPFDRSVKKFIKKAYPPKCSQRITKVEDQRIVIDEKFVKSWKTKSLSCCYRAIHRVEQKPDAYNNDADWAVKYSGQCQNIPLGKEGAFLNDTFVKVECKGSGKKGSVEFQGTLIPPKNYLKETQKKAEYWDQSRANGLENPPSVLVIGVDSISRMHMMRSLPKTREYILKNDFIELKGYNKIGENTFPNIMAAFGGMELNNYSSCWANKSVKMDDCPFLWKSFSDLNYMTAFLEDSPGIAIFNYLKLGFVHPPADYYMRPLTVAMHKYHGWSRNSGRADCVGGKAATDYQIGYIENFVKAMGKDYPYFLFTWFTSIGHDDFNGLKTADNAFENLFSTAMRESSADPDNTIMIFMSDHGYRFGKFRETFLGFYEESLPFFYFRLPPSLKKVHPDWYANLKRNSQMLTSPLDLHSTLKQILYNVNATLHNNSPSATAPQLNSIDIQLLGNSNEQVMTNLTEYTFDNTTSSEPVNQQFRARYSFFEYVPVNRTCESSSIPQRYCMCGVIPVITKTSVLSSQLADIVITQLNSMLQSVIETGKCATLKYSKFMYGREVGHGEIWNNFSKLVNYKDYLVALEASPSKAHFESKIRIFQNSTAVILGGVSRINSYKGQSDCIGDFKLRTMCFCKTKEKAKVITKEITKKPKVNNITTSKVIITTVTNLPTLKSTEKSLKNSTQGNNITTSSVPPIQIQNKII